MTVQHNDFRLFLRIDSDDKFCGESVRPGEYDVEVVIDIALDLWIAGRDRAVRHVLQRLVSITLHKRM